MNNEKLDYFAYCVMQTLRREGRTVYESATNRGKLIVTDDYEAMHNQQKTATINELEEMMLQDDISADEALYEYLESGKRGKEMCECKMAEIADVIICCIVGIYMIRNYFPAEKIRCTEIYFSMISIAVNMAVELERDNLEDYIEAKIRYNNERED